MPYSVPVLNQIHQASLPVVSMTTPTWWVEINQPQATLLASTAVLVSAGIAFTGVWLNHKREKKSARHVRYTAIAEQLSHSSAFVRLAGIYALEALANEWQYAKEGIQRDVVVELLCSYLRVPSGQKDDEEVRATIIAVLRTHSNVIARGMGMNSPIVTKILWGSLIRQSRTYQISWPSSIINLNGADLTNAKMNMIILQDARLSGVNLTGANLIKADLREANMSGARLGGAHLWGADLRGTDLSGAVFVEDGVKETIFCKPQGEGRSGKSDKLKWDSNTKWPNGFDIEGAIRRQEEVAGPPPGPDSDPRLA